MPACAPLDVFDAEIRLNIPARLHRMSLRDSLSWVKLYALWHRNQFQLIMRAFLSISLLV
jgi:hypothetical protein